MDIESIKRKLLVKYPFFGSVVAKSNFIAKPDVGTAGTDGKNIYYNPNFIESITAGEQIFIFAHEICHIAFNHIFRSEGKDKYLWNIATDSVINAFLKQDGLSMAEGAVNIPEAINYDAEEMYKKLLEVKKQQEGQDNGQDQKGNQQQSGGEQNEQENGQDQKSSQQQSGDNGQSENDEQQSQLQQQSGNEQDEQDNAQNQKCSQQQSGDNGQQSSSSSKNVQEQDKQLQGQNGSGLDEDSQKKERQQDVGHDTHSMWEKAIEKRHQEEQSQSNSGQSDKDEDKQSWLDKNQEKEMNAEINELAELGETEVFKQNRIVRKKQLEELRTALARQSHGYGNTTNGERRNITDIGISKPLIDWRRLLKEAVKYDVDWSYQNAGIEDGVVTAYLEEIPRPETEILLDTSGSIDEKILRNFLRECKNILQTSKIKVGCFDTRFYGFTEIKDLSDIDNLPFYGGGGTNFNVAVNAFSRRVENKIIFTDGEAPMPDMPLDAIWIVFGGRKINPKGGKVIYIDSKQLDKLGFIETTNERHGRSR